MPVTTKQLTARNTAEFMEMLRLFENVFEMKNFNMPDTYYLRNLLNKNDFLVFAAIHNGTVIGGLTAYVLSSYYTASAEVYIYDLAVSNSWQRKGVGKKLLQSIADYCRQHQYHEFFVQADIVDAHAVSFYQSTGGAPEDVIHFSYAIR